MQKRGRVLRCILFCMIAAAVLPACSVGLWLDGGSPLCTAAGNQYGTTIISDDVGGAIVAWHDNRGGDNDIYAQKVNASGDVEWVLDGVGLCNAIGNQNVPTITSDGARGAIVTWYDTRSGSAGDVYAQRVSGSGVVEWDPDGVKLSTASGAQYDPTIASDGAGGAIVAWYDNRSGSYDIYAQRVNTSGAVQWAENGVALCTATGEQRGHTITSDGAGGAIIAWHDSRSASYYDIYAQRINASGVVQWAPDGVALCTATRNQYEPTITSDGAGGAIVAWHDYRSGFYADIYVQMVSASGVVQWAADGVALCTATSDQVFPTLTSDGAGGAIAVWNDLRSGSYEVYLQKVDASGVVKWVANGVAVCTATPERYDPTITSDGAGGAIVAWHDTRSGISGDVYAQRISVSGDVEWASDGVALSTAGGHQTLPKITSDGERGAIVAWYDTRGSSYDIYAQRVDSLGALIDVGQGEPRASVTLLEQNVPNPFNPVTVIRFAVAEPARVKLVVYDVNGRRVRVLVDGATRPGPHEARWDGRDDRGRPVASGVYLCVLDAPGYRGTKKTVLLR